MSASRTRAKALLLRNALRAASTEGISAQSMGLYAVLIAEAWPVNGIWIARLGWPLLERRLGASRASLKRWATELEDANLVQRIPGDGQRLSEWGIFRRKTSDTPTRGCAREPPGGAPVNPGGGAHEPPGGAPVNPVSESSQGSIQSSSQSVADVAEPWVAPDCDARRQQLRKLVR